MSRWCGKSHSAARFLQRLASFARVLMLDKRGTGLSDRVPATALPTLEERMDDLHAVMDHAGISRGAVLAASEGGAMGVVFSATYPERVSALLLWSTYPRWDFPEGSISPDEFEAAVAERRRQWETGDFDVESDIADLEAAEKERLRRWLPRYRRSSASPGAAEALLRMPGIVMCARSSRRSGCRRCASPAPATETLFRLVTSPNRSRARGTSNSPGAHTCSSSETRRPRSERSRNS